jgi:succinate-acetate transporter protein
MSQNETIFKQVTGNPAPLGLAGFGLTTILLNIHNAGFYPLNAMIIAMGIFYGGIGQIIVGYMEWKKNNTFGTIAFTSYGLFWLSLVGCWVFPTVFGVEKPSGEAMACFLAMWGVLSFFLFLGTFKANRALQVVFGSLVVLFALLTAAKATENEVIEHIAGYEGIFCGTSALYAAMAGVLNEKFGRTILPE